MGGNAIMNITILKQLDGGLLTLFICIMRKNLK